MPKASCGAGGLALCGGLGWLEREVAEVREAALTLEFDPAELRFSDDLDRAIEEVTEHGRIGEILLVLLRPVLVLDLPDLVARVKRIGDDAVRHLEAEMLVALRAMTPRGSQC